MDAVSDGLMAFHGIKCLSKLGYFYRDFKKEVSSPAIRPVIHPCKI